MLQYALFCYISAKAQVNAPILLLTVLIPFRENKQQFTYPSVDYHEICCFLQEFLLVFCSLADEFLGLHGISSSDIDSFRAKVPLQDAILDRQPRFTYSCLIHKHNG